jgi:hypothetical protein
MNLKTAVASRKGRDGRCDQGSSFTTAAASFTQLVNASRYLKSLPLRPLRSLREAQLRNPE